MKQNSRALRQPARRKETAQELLARQTADAVDLERLVTAVQETQLSFRIVVAERRQGAQVPAADAASVLDLDRPEGVAPVDDEVHLAAGAGAPGWRAGSEGTIRIDRPIRRKALSGGRLICMSQPAAVVRPQMGWGSKLPRISEFYGIAIYLYYRDHAPPHFHAIYAQYDAVVNIADGRIRRGALPPRAEALVREWARRYRTELECDWELARSEQPLMPIPPLE